MGDSSVPDKEGAGNAKPPEDKSSPAKGKGKGSGGKMGEDDIKKMIIGHEGMRLEPYQDTKGLWTVGVGHLIGKSLPPEWNKTFTTEQMERLFDQEYAHHRSKAEGIPGFNKLDSKGQGALTDLTFNMGPSWYKKFPRFTAALEKGDMEGAASRLENSAWYGQVGARAPKIVDMVRNSSVQAKAGGVFDGSMSGYPATLHGTELVAPIDPQSILMKLAKTPADKAPSSAEKSSQSDELATLQQIAQMIGTLIAVTEGSHSISKKILQTARS